MTVIEQPLTPTVNRQVIYQAALSAHRAGISVVPIPLNGTKHPAFKWEVYQRRLPSPLDLRQWFLHERNGLAFVAGAVSGNLELLDFDSHEVYWAWRERMEEEGVGALASRLARGYLERTPNGMHQWYRCRTIEGNQPLARILLGPRQRKAVIETRGEGGLGVVAPSGDGVHRSGRPYVALQGSVEHIQTITVPERQRLFSVARMFDECPPPPPPLPSKAQERAIAHNEEGELPGRIFNRRASWEQILVPFGWRYLYPRGEEGYWTKNRDVHATTNYSGSDLFYVFSTATIFEPNCGYSKFAAYTLLNYGSTRKEAFRAAARDLAAQGYTDR